MTSRVIELFGESTSSDLAVNRWNDLVARQHCPYLGKVCIKNRKSTPDIAIGTCTVAHGAERTAVMICPHRLLERRKIFADCIHLLTLHEPGNELHIISEVTLPGGNVDYFLASARSGRVRDFIGIELQTLDSTGTVWPERQRFLNSIGFAVEPSDVNSEKTFGMNWKMTAKTILVQLHHKVETFEQINKKLVLVVQDHLLSYMQSNFAFGHMAEPPRTGDTMHLHAYRLLHQETGQWRMELARRISTDAVGVGTALGRQAGAKVELATIVRQLESKISRRTLFDLGPIRDVTLRTNPS